MAVIGQIPESTIQINDLAASDETVYSSEKVNDLLSAKLSSINKTMVEAVLTGEISSHSHAGSGGGLSQPQVLARNLGC